MSNILIKLSGTIFGSSAKQDVVFLDSLIDQIKELKKENNIALVVGAGNIFRGSQHGKQLNLNQTTAHTVGMVATIINGLILQDFLQKKEVDSVVLSAIECPKIAGVIKQDCINKSIKEKKVIIFVAGTGNPFFTTDTNAVLRALQIGASTIYKCTDVDGIYQEDPKKNPQSLFYKKITYKEFIEKDLKVMDLTAITLAKENSLKIRVFNVFEPNSLIKAYKESDFGSLIY